MLTTAHAPERYVPCSTKANPAWWFRNVNEPEPPAWYEGPRWRWKVRNPLHNFLRYVVGVADREFVFVSRHPGVFAPEPGRWQIGYVTLGWICLPFVSYVRGRFQFNLGWDYQGALGGAFRLEKWRG